MARLPHLTQRGRDTQRLLRETVMQLILEKGLDKVTVTDITERAGIDRTTFYLHYTGKQDLLEQSQREIIDDLLGDAPPAEPGAALHRAFEHMANNATAYRVLLASADTSIDRRIHDYISERIGPLLRQRLAPHSTISDLELNIVAQYVTSALRGTGRWWLEQGMPMPPEEMATYFQRILMFGLISFIGGQAPGE